MPLRSTLLALALAAVLPAAASAAPGRVVFPTGAVEPSPSVDVGGAGAAAALPDGGAILAGILPDRRVAVARIGADGAPAGPVAQVTLPVQQPMPGPVPGAVTTFALAQVLVQPDRRIVLLGGGPARARDELPELLVVRLTPDGALDGSFGTGGVARPGIQLASGIGRPGGLTASGGIVVAGNVGKAGPPTPTGSAESTFQPVVARLTATGAPDPSFGGGDGIAEAGFGTGFQVGGYSATPLPDGRIVAFGRDGSGTTVLARLLPDGSPDPTYHGGTPAPVGAPLALEVLVRPDGRADVRGKDALVRMTATGEQDPAFAPVALGPAGVGAGLVADGDGVLVLDAFGPYGVRPVTQGDVRIRRVSAAGAVESDKTLRLGFGGGEASVFARLKPRPLPTFPQSGFGLGEAVRRPDGSLLLAGGVRLVRYTGEGVGLGTGRFAVAALGADLRPLASFGGAAVMPKLTVRIPAQRASSDHRLKRVLLRVTASGPGMALVKVRSGRTVVAQGVEAVFKPGTSALRVRLTRSGERLLRSGRRRSLVAVASFRDLEDQRITATRRGSARGR